MSLNYFDSIRYGEFADIEVLVDPGSLDLWVSQPVIERMLELPSNSVRRKLRLKSLESFAGKGLALGRKIKAKDITGRPNEVVAIPFNTFLIFVIWQSKQGNEAADRLLLAGFADSFKSVVLEQCGIKVELSNRQKTIQHYLTRYHEFQDWIRDEHLRMYGVKPTDDYYRQVAVAINTALCGKTHFNCDRIEFAREEELRDIEAFERYAMRKKIRYDGKDPLAVTMRLLNDYT